MLLQLRGKSRFSRIPPKKYRSGKHLITFVEIVNIFFGSLHCCKQKNIEQIVMAITTKFLRRKKMSQVSRNQKSLCLEKIEVGR